MEILDFLEDQENDKWRCRSHGCKGSGEERVTLPLKETTNHDEDYSKILLADYCNTAILQQVKRLQGDALELRRTNKELQLQNRDLNVKLAAAQAHISTLLAKKDMAEAEAALLRPANQELRRQVEGLQNQRFSEVEELVYLRWVNACLRYELRNIMMDSTVNCQAMQLSKVLSPNSGQRAKRLVLEYAGAELATSRTDNNDDGDCDTTSKSSESSCGFPALEQRQNGNKPSFIRKLSRTWSRKRNNSFGYVARPPADDRRDTYNSTSIAESLQIMSRSMVADKYPAFKDRHKLAVDSAPEASSSSSSAAAAAATASLSARPPPPPPPLPPPRPAVMSSSSPLASSSDNKLRFQRAPQVIELYHAMTKRDVKKDAPSTATAAARVSVDEARSSIIGEIENRSSHLLAIKADVENQRELVVSLAAEVRAADYTEMEDVLAFVTWLDGELALLVDERAVLKHFNWPEAKADALRESAFQYRDLRKLELELASFEDDYGMKRDPALNRMQTVMERTEHSIYCFLRTRDKAAIRYKESGIPTNWMLDGGLVGKVKCFAAPQVHECFDQMKESSVKLAEKFMKRVVLELDGAGSDELVEEFLLLQGVRFAFRVHQFAGGFDDKTMQAFEELRSRARRTTPSCML
ncbi:protein CHUP1, chloroplastic [Selaginella moellendorffii]|uniref:protein CHUP1, chloroplastic n=1 Tax=Selaginella moellendorffii TaxID=88036 RepID=UPI000D1C3505|nr:protein CHUP1, chloroplastic [Selaginella moellendorffii]|eukprot:XP_024526674.1 protein CHUP1, chloroplastic [Selaginella moellendorffii]